MIELLLNLLLLTTHKEIYRSCSAKRDRHAVVFCFFVSLLLRVQDIAIHFLIPRDLTSIMNLFRESRLGQLFTDLAVTKDNVKGVSCRVSYYYYNPFLTPRTTNQPIISFKIREKQMPVVVVVIAASQSVNYIKKKKKET